MKIIKSRAFYNASKIAVITIPNTTTEIETSAFENSCSSSTIAQSANAKLTIGTSVSSIANSAFSGMTRLIAIDYNATLADDKDISKMKEQQMLLLGLKNEDEIETNHDMYKLTQRIIDKKSDFASSLLYIAYTEGVKWITPKYIQEGLKWLQTQ